MAFAKHCWVRACGMVGMTCALGFVLVSSETSTRQSYRQRVVNTGKPALHAVHSARLEELMVDLAAHVPEEWGAPAEQEKALRELAEVAAETADAAQHIPDVLAEVNLPQSEREIFKKLAKKLETEARELEQHAKKKDMDDIQSSIDEMIATCNACHTAFRVMPTATGR